MKNHPIARRWPVIVSTSTVIVLSVVFGVRLFLAVKSVNEPDPASVNPRDVEAVVAKYGVSVGVSQVLYVYRDTDMYIFKGTVGERTRREATPCGNGLSQVSVSDTVTGRVRYVRYSEPSAGPSFIGVMLKGGEFPRFERRWEEATGNAAPSACVQAFEREPSDRGAVRLPDDNPGPTLSRFAYIPERKP